MIYFATVHVGSARWIDMQTSFLHRNISEPFSVYASLQDVPSEHTRISFDRVVPAAGEHAGKLNLLAGEIVRGCQVRGHHRLPRRRRLSRRRRHGRPSHRALEESALVAVRRDENATDTPTPPVVLCACGCVTGSACMVIGHRDTAGRPSTGVCITDVGGNLLAALGAIRGHLDSPAPKQPGQPPSALVRRLRRHRLPPRCGVSAGRWAASTSPTFHACTPGPSMSRSWVELLVTRNQARAQRFHARTAAEAGQSAR